MNTVENNWHEVVLVVVVVYSTRLELTLKKVTLFLQTSIIGSSVTLG